MNYVIIGMDNVLADNSHRLQHRDDDVMKFYGSCEDDIPYGNAVKLIRSLDYHNTFVYVIADRPKAIKAKTQNWLTNHIGLEFPDNLVMRPNNDSRPLSMFKEEWFQSHFSEIDKSDILFVLDNGIECVEMWRRNGVFCLQSL